jgi:peptidoglycan L-alanyl-D-glutamate endopeptidase CwlK|tara:strand:+ start:935 stop:1342 length:408 start_codon:yes stop_codon:yes gene_type:complete
MPRYSSRSKRRLATCDQRLQDVFNEVIKHVDCSILEGYRNKERQNKLYDEKRTKVKYPNGRHNVNPSKAVDVTPYPVDWEDRERQTLFAGFVIGIARSMGIKIRWGGNWDMYSENGRWEVKDNRFDDFPHFEIKE